MTVYLHAQFHYLNNKKQTQLRIKFKKGIQLLYNILMTRQNVVFLLNKKSLYFRNGLHYYGETSIKIPKSSTCLAMLLTLGCIVERCFI